MWGGGGAVSGVSGSGGGGGGGSGGGRAVAVLIAGCNLETVADPCVRVITLNAVCVISFWDNRRSDAADTYETGSHA